MAKEPFFRAPKVVLILIAILVCVHVAILLGGQNWQVWSLYALSFIPARISGGAPFPAIWGSQVWSFVTYGFLHADMMHLFFNSLWFLVFGSVVARRLGTLKFLVLTGVSTVMGAVATLLTHWGEVAIVIGASGAVSGLMAAAIPLMYGVGLRLGDTYRMDIATVQAVAAPGNSDEPAGIYFHFGLDCRHSVFRRQRLDRRLIHGGRTHCLGSPSWRICGRAHRLLLA